MNNKLPDFLCVPCAIIINKRMTSLDGLVYGVIYWYSRQKLEKCILANPAFAELLDVDSRSIQRSLARLEEQGFIRILYKNNFEKQRTEIIPLITFQSHSENRDTTLQSYQKDESTTGQSYQTISDDISTTDESYKYDPTVIPLRPGGHINTTPQSYAVESGVRPYGHQNNIENNKQERVNKKASHSPRKKPIEVAEDGNDLLISQLLEHFNQVRETKFIAIKPLRANFKYWISIYDLDFMKQAINNIHLSEYWKNKMTPEILLRRTNPRREEVDYIGELYNLRIEQTPTRKNGGKRNATQEYLSGQSPLEFDQSQEVYGQTTPIF